MHCERGRCLRNNNAGGARETIDRAPSPHDTVMPPTEPSTSEATTTTTTLPPIKVATTWPPSPAVAVPATTTAVNVTDGQLPQAMPEEVQGHRASGGLQAATVRVTADGKAHLIPDYAVLTNSCEVCSSCSGGRWRTTRLRLSSGGPTLRPRMGRPRSRSLDPSSPATGGYWTGDYCQQPAFGMSAAASDGSSSTDATSDNQWWMAGPA